MDIEDPIEEYVDIKRHLVQFLESQEVNVEANSILSENLCLYIFGCFRINPYNKQGSPGRVRFSVFPHVY